MTASASATSTTLARSGTLMPASGVPAISQAVDRVDGGESCVHGLELAPDALHVRSDGRVVDHDVRVAHQLLAVLDVPGEARERMHQPEFRQREIDCGVAPRGLEALHVEPERPALERLPRGWRLAQQIRAATERADAREELRQARVLGEVVVGA